MGKRLNLTNGVSFGGRYTVLAADLAVSAVAEVLTLTVTAGCAVDGNVGVVIRGATAVQIAVTTTADTAAEVATLIRAGTFTGWTTSGTGADVIFTASAAGVKTGTNSISAGSTGVAGTFAITTLGTAAADGSVTFDFMSSMGSEKVDYDMAVQYSVVSSANVFQPLTDAVLTYPAKGQSKIADGSTFKLAEGDIITVIAQRAVTV